MTKYSRLFSATLFLCLLITLPSCILSPPKDFYFTVAPVSHTLKPNIPLKVGLQLTDEFQTATWVSPEHKITFHVGEVISEKAKEVSQAIFSNVVIVDNKQALTSGEVKAVLIPQLITFERTRPVFGTQDTIDIAIIQWTLTDMNNSLVWIDTISAEGTSSVTGGEAARAALTLNPWKVGQIAAERGMTVLAEDFFNKSVAAMRSSVEIAEFAKESGGK